MNKSIQKETNDTGNTRESRIFKDCKDYFYLWEESAWIQKFNPETKRLDIAEVTGWSKTHIIIQKCAMSGDIGIQILRFESNAEQNTLELKSNPYAGVYLTPEEWKQIENRLDNPL